MNVFGSMYNHLYDCRTQKKSQAEQRTETRFEFEIAVQFQLVNFQHQTTDYWSVSYYFPSSVITC